MSTYLRLMINSTYMDDSSYTTGISIGFMTKSWTRIKCQDGIFYVQILWFIFMLCHTKRIGEIGK